MGDVTKVDLSALPKIDLLIGGSPCQGFSRAGKGLNFNDPRSKLFFEYVKILNYLKNRNPNVLFLLENVNMKKEWEDVITEYLQVKPIMINSNLVSAQNRKRLYWTNIPNIEQPKDKYIFPKDIIENWTPNQHASACNVKREFKFKDKFSTITATYWKGIRGAGRPAVSTKEGLFDEDRSAHRMLSPIEAERLQTLPDDYTEGICKTQRYKCIGNGWTVNVIVHIFKSIEIHKSLDLTA